MMSLTLSDGVKKWLNGMTSPSGSITYLAAVARLTVDSWMPSSAATAARLSGRRWRTPLARNSRCLSTRQVVMLWIVWRRWLMFAMNSLARPTYC